MYKGIVVLDTKWKLLSRASDYGIRKGKCNRPTPTAEVRCAHRLTDPILGHLEFREVYQSIVYESDAGVEVRVLSM